VFNYVVYTHALHVVSAMNSSTFIITYRKPALAQFVSQDELITVVYV